MQSAPEDSTSPEQPRHPFLYVVCEGEGRVRIPSGSLEIFLDQANRVELSLRRTKLFVLLVSIAVRSESSKSETRPPLGMCVIPRAGNSISICFGSHQPPAAISQTSRLEFRNERQQNQQLEGPSHSLGIEIDSQRGVSISADSVDRVLVVQFEVEQRRLIGALEKHMGTALMVQPTAANLIMIGLQETTALRIG